jgi:serine/threonine protein phosphatase PrpC
MFRRAVAGTTGASLVFGRVAAWCRPTASRLSPTGQDGFYIARSGRSIGVADGIGAWSSDRVDPSVITRKLTRFARERADELEREPGDPAVRPFTSQAILQHAFKRALLDKDRGSCTAIFATLEGGDLAPSLVPSTTSRAHPPAHVGQFGILNVANVGDSQLMVLRPRSGIVFISPDQENNDNCPYELGPGWHSPSDGSVVDVVVAEHDVVVMGTDGLFDNMRKRDVLATLNAHLRADVSEIDCADVATALGTLARKNGWKCDDITIIVAQVQQQQQQ